MNRLIYDIEIKNPIPNKDGILIGGIDYARNWGDFEGMGIAVIGYKWNNEPANHCFDVESFFSVLMALDQSHKLVGFNSRSFDDKLLDACGLDGVTTDYDLLEEIRIAAGFGKNFRSVTRGYSYSLDAISKANGFAKTGDSRDAPILWQRGEKQRVIDCATIDCDVTSAILDLGLAGQLIDPNTGNNLLLKGLE